MLIPLDPDMVADSRPCPSACLASGLMRLVLAFSKIAGLFSHASQTRGLYRNNPAPKWGEGRDLATGAIVSLRRALPLSRLVLLLSPASPMGVEGGKPPRQTLPGITRSVAPKGRLLSLKDRSIPVSGVLWADLRAERLRPEAGSAVHNICEAGRAAWYRRKRGSGLVESRGRRR